MNHNTDKLSSWLDMTFNDLYSLCDENNNYELIKHDPMAYNEQFFKLLEIIYDIELEDAILSLSEDSVKIEYGTKIIKIKPLDDIVFNTLYVKE